MLKFSFLAIHVDLPGAMIWHILSEKDNVPVR